MERMYVRTAEDEHVEMYLKAMCIIEEEGRPLKISTIARVLDIQQPSVIQMLRKLDGKNLITYSKLGIAVNEQGRRIGQNTIRKGRLLEAMMTELLRINADPKIICGIEHHMSDEFTDALSDLLGNPDRTPSGKSIPPGARSWPLESSERQAV